MEENKTKNILNNEQKELHLKKTESFFIYVFLGSCESFLDLF